MYKLDVIWNMAIFSIMCQKAEQLESLIEDLFNDSHFNILLKEKFIAYTSDTSPQLKNQQKVNEQYEPVQILVQQIDGLLTSMIKYQIDKATIEVIETMQLPDLIKLQFEQQLNSIKQQIEHLKQGMLQYDSKLNKLNNVSYILPQRSMKKKLQQQKHKICESIVKSYTTSQSGFFKCNTKKQMNEDFSLDISFINNRLDDLSKQQSHITRKMIDHTQCIETVHNLKSQMEEMLKASLEGVWHVINEMQKKISSVKSTVLIQHDDENLPASIKNITDKRKKRGVRFD